MLQVGLRNFTQEVMKSKHPVLVTFSAPWCGACKRLKPVLESVEADTHGLMKVVQVNVEEEKELAWHYKVSGLPMTVLVDQGQEIGRMPGLQNARAWLKLLGKVLPIQPVGYGD